MDENPYCSPHSTAKREARMIKASSATLLIDALAVFGAAIFLLLMDFADKGSQVAVLTTVVGLGLMILAVWLFLIATVRLVKGSFNHR